MIWPIPWLKKSTIGPMIELISMGKRIVQPLPVRDGLNPSRVRFPDDAPPMTAYEFVEHLIATQRYVHPDDDAAALDKRFADQEVVDQRGNPFQPSDMMKAGVDIWFYRIPAPEKVVPHQIGIIHEDAELLVVDKPAFLATFPRGSHITESVLVRMRRQTGNQELSPAHRLDRLTSGVLVLTKKREIRGVYQELFARREVDKVYEAIADANPQIATGTVWEHRMEKERGEFKTRLVDGPINARTEVNKVIPVTDSEQARLEEMHGLLPPQARYELHPLTGRTHQLRLHMFTAGSPILGDPVYPDVLPVDAEDFDIPMHLLSRRLSFVDPLTGTPREFVSHLSPILGTLLNPM
ncbi:23S rRNA pseudouridylate synthase [Corynebacterium hindlerae]|uniref:pseudouridine synthase n=1 Tax=Corynebacterium hindlerae TaxID=699041 RepID=UPI001AD72D5D|nr:pseudouridine synthase [Corynebacterium hindlerae]QTH60004.1 23S rRNA pseudouridylate synthase [Corynebacterium hindlerae]